MKLLLLADGRSIHTIRYQKEMKANGVDLILASLERGETVDVQLKKRSVANSLNYFFVNREIKELVRKIKPDIVNPHFASGYGFSVAMSKAWKRIPVALHCLGSDILVSPQKSIAHKRRVVYALARATMVFTDSDYLTEQVRDLYSVKKIEVVPWGVENEIVDLFKKKITDIQKIKGPLKTFVPRPHQKVYNNEFIIESLIDKLVRKEVALTFPDWGDLSDRFKKYIKKQCPDALIDFYKFKSRPEYIDFISKFDIYLSASLSDSSPASLIEAMGAGLIPVTADIPGVREWLDESNGFLFNNNNCKSLSEAIDKVILSLSDIGQILETNHKKVLADGLFENNIKKTINVMESVLNSGK